MTQLNWNIISTYLWTSTEIHMGCTMLAPACERTDHPSRSSVMMETQILAVCHQISGEKAVWSLDYWQTTTRTLQQLPHTTTVSIIFIYVYLWSVYVLYCIFNELSMKFIHYNSNLYIYTNQLWSNIKFMNEYIHVYSIVSPRRKQA